MNAVLSFLISAGIIAFGLWTITYSIEAGSPIGFTLMGILPVAIGSISLFTAQFVKPSSRRMLHRVKCRYCACRCREIFG